MLSSKVFLLGTLCLILVVVNSVSGEIRLKKGTALVKLNKPNQFIRGTVKASRQERSFYAFYGVRYAKPPQRFERPEPLEDDEHENITVVDAFEYGSSCARWSRFLKKYTGSEDCLYLNVFVPDIKPKPPLPVMIYIHGGAFADGESESHGPEFFMDEDVILVTMNYRLGALGFLSTGDRVIPGNMALHDQALAIKWVHDNIETFGGDVNQITLFGESAGAVSTNLHMLYPPNKGLFSQAIMQSGTAHATWAIQHRESARIHLEKLSTLAGCDHGEGTQAVVECLRAKSWEELLDAQNKTQKWFPGLSLPFAPVIEVKHPNAFLSEDPDFLMRTGQVMNIPSIIGINEEEGYYVYSEVILKNGKMLRMLNSDFNAVGPDLYYYTKRHLRNPEKGADHEQAISSRIREFYFGDAEIGEKTSQGLIDLSSDRSFSVGIERTAKVLSEEGNEKVYTYIFSFKGEHTLVSSLMKEGKIVVSHADELQYLFNSQRFGSREGFTKDSDSEKISKSFVKVWATFAKHGSPSKSSWNNVSTSKWTPLSKGQEMFWYGLHSEPKVVRGYHTERHEFWNQLLKEYFSSSDEAVQNYNKNVKTEL